MIIEFTADNANGGDQTVNRSPAVRSDGSAQVCRSEGYVDIHCHCLPGLDDGPEDMAEAVRLCEALVQDGIGTVIATPHQMGRFDGCNWAPEVRKSVDQLRQTLASRGIALELAPGADVRVDERLCELIKEDKVLTIGDAGKSILLELPHEVFVDIGFLMAMLNELGIRSVVSHPERNRFLMKHPDAVQRWLECEPCLQLTAASIVGLFGRTAQHACQQFLYMPFPLVVATDAHDVNSRAPCMTAAYMWLKDHMGEKVAQLLCIENPTRIIQGRDLIRIGDDR